MSDYTGPNHVVTVRTWQVTFFDDAGAAAETQEVDYEIEHPVECDALKYGELCALDRMVHEDGWEVTSVPEETGRYRVCYWSSGPDYWGEYDCGTTVEKIDDDAVAAAEHPAPMGDPWASIPADGAS